MPLGLGKVFKKRIRQLCGLFFKWLRRKKKIRFVNIPRFLFCSKRVRNEVNQFMSESLKFIFLERVEGKDVNLIENIQRIDDIFKSVHLITLLTKKIQDYFIIYEESIKGYSLKAQKKIIKLIGSLEDKRLVKKLYEK